MGEAQAAYVQSMLRSFGGDARAFRDFMLLDRGFYQEMGQINADAIKGLQPSISVWSMENGGAGGGRNDNRSGANVYRALPPLAAAESLEHSYNSRSGDLSPAYSVEL